MLSSRTKQVLGCGIVVVAAMLAWTCAAGLKDMGFSGGPSANRLSLQNEQHEMRRRLKGQVGDSGVNVEDDNVIMIGVLPSSYGKDNLTRIPSEMHVTQGKSPKLTWICWEGPFTLTFRPGRFPDGGPQTLRDTPLEGMQTDVAGGNALPSVASATVRSDAGVGRYEFTIHVALDDGGSADDNQCPPIIID